MLKVNRQQEYAVQFYFDFFCVYFYVYFILNLFTFRSSWGTGTRGNKKKKRKSLLILRVLRCKAITEHWQQLEQQKHVGGTHISLKEENSLCKWKRLVCHNKIYLCLLNDMNDLPCYHWNKLHAFIYKGPGSDHRNVCRQGCRDKNSM